MFFELKEENFAVAFSDVVNIWTYWDDLPLDVVLIQMYKPFEANKLDDIDWQ